MPSSKMMDSISSDSKDYLVNTEEGYWPTPINDSQIANKSYAGTNNATIAGSPKSSTYAGGTPIETFYKDLKCSTHPLPTTTESDAIQVYKRPNTSSVTTPMQKDLDEHYALLPPSDISKALHEHGSCSLTSISHDNVTTTTNSVLDEDELQSHHCSIASPSEPESRLPGTYFTAQGQKVSFRQKDSIWVAHVTDAWGRRQVLPVVCAPDQTTGKIIASLAEKASEQHKYLIHILETDLPPWAPRVVYVGFFALKGGGNRQARCQTCNYPFSVSRGNDSDDEFCNEIKINNRSTIYCSTSNNWCLEERLFADTKARFPIRAEAAMCLSPNDVRNVSRWTFHSCNVGWSNCYVPDDSYATIVARRSKRQEERKKRREAQHKKRQEELKRKQEQEAERKRQEELKRKQEQEAERKRQEELKRKQEQVRAIIAKERHELVRKIAKSTEQDLEQYCPEFSITAKQETQLKIALEHLPGPTVPETENQLNLQGYSSIPRLRDIDSMLTQSLFDKKQEESTRTVDEEDRFPSTLSVEVEERVLIPQSPPKKSSYQLQQKSAHIRPFDDLMRSQQENVEALLKKTRDHFDAYQLDHSASFSANQAAE